MSVSQILVEISQIAYISEWNYEISTLLSTLKPPNITGIIQKPDMREVDRVSNWFPQFIIHFIRA